MSVIKLVQLLSAVEIHSVATCSLLAIVKRTAREPATKTVRRIARCIAKFSTVPVKTSASTSV